MGLIYGKQVFSIVFFIFLIFCLFIGFLLSTKTNKIKSRKFMIKR